MGDHAGHRSRLRQLYMEQGLQNFAAHNVLELYLFSTIPRKDTNLIAHRLLHTFGSLEGVFRAPYEELVKVEGIGPQAAALITMHNQIERRLNLEHVNGMVTLNTTALTKDFVFHYLCKAPTEEILLICLDARMRMLDARVIEVGTIGTASIDKRKIAELALRFPTSGVIMAHNHPYGECKPSTEDIDITGEIKTMLQSVGVALLDHLIVTPSSTMSMAEHPSFQMIFRKKEKNSSF